MRPRVADRKSVISFSQPESNIRKLDRIAELQETSRSEVIGDLMETTIDSYKETSERIHKKLYSLTEKGDPFCMQCALQDWKATGTMKEDKAYQDGNLIKIKKERQRDARSPKFQEQISSIYFYACPRGHKLSVTVPMYRHNPFKDFPEGKDEILPEELKAIRAKK